MTLEQDLPDALSRGELDLIYQPIIDLVAATADWLSRPCCAGATRGWAPCCRPT